MSDELLRHPLHSGHLTVGALKRNKDKPVLFLGDTTLTGGQLADRISQYIQAFEALGAGTGSAVGLLSLNRPEVLMIIGAGQTQGYRRTALHPLGSLDDHAYVLSDAGVTSLIIDPNPMFVERALGLLEKVPVAQADPDDRPGARRAGRRGRRPDRRGGQVLAAAAGRRRSAARSHRRHGLHRRHHRQAQGRDRHGAVDHHDDDDPARRVGVAGESAVPDVHAAVARGCGVLRADDRQGRRDDRADQVRSGRGAARPSRSRRSRRRCWCRR